MALGDYFPLAFLGDRLCVRGVTIDQARQDEMSGSGDGRYWSAQLAKPLWRFQIDLHDQHAAKAREINAKVWALNGTQRGFVFADPTYVPASGATSLPGVTVASISADRTSIGLAGLPVNQRVSWGDYFSIFWNNSRFHFGAFAEEARSGALGSVANIAVTPWVSHGVEVGMPVELIRPRCKVIVPPGGFTPYSFHRNQRWGSGASLSVLQKVTP